MRFAILGNHPDGQAMAAALVASGRHELAAGKVSDLEEVLADPEVDAVIVGGDLAVRPAQLRRALQSERHVMCVYPPDQTPDIAYEADMIRQDTGRVLLPLLPGPTYPALRRLAEFIHLPGKGVEAFSPVGAFLILEMERVAPRLPDGKPTFPGWDLLRALGGEIAEISGFAAEEHPEAGEPVLASGRFERGGLFHVTYLPDHPDAQGRLTVVGDRGRAELVFPASWQGPAFLDWRDESGELREEAWDAWDPWPVLVERFEAAVADGAPTWLDAVRGVELDDALRRSTERRRTSVLEYQEASEETGFKGTMTLVGCGLIWAILVLVVLSFWFPKIGWVIVPLLVVFLGMQFLRYLIPGRRTSGERKE
jgi:predicted dehydrogenase